MRQHKGRERAGPADSPWLVVSSLIDLVEDGDGGGIDARDRDGPVYTEQVVVQLGRDMEGREDAWLGLGRRQRQGGFVRRKCEQPPRQGLVEDAGQRHVCSAASRCRNGL